MSQKDRCARWTNRGRSAKVDSAELSPQARSREQFLTTNAPRIASVKPMPQTITGKPAQVAGSRVAIVVSRYNASITEKLLAGAVNTLSEHGIADESILVAYVPGSFEVPLVADRLARTMQYGSVICLGAVIRGETTHDQHINRAVSARISETALSTGVPVLFGILTCDTLEQAIERAGGRHGNKGAECALAALEMMDLLAQLPS